MSNLPVIPESHFYESTWDIDRANNLLSDGKTICLWEPGDYYNGSETLVGGTAGKIWSVPGARFVYTGIGDAAQIGSQGRWVNAGLKARGAAVTNPEVKSIRFTEGGGIVHGLKSDGFYNHVYFDKCENTFFYGLVLVNGLGTGITGNPGNAQNATHFYGLTINNLGDGFDLESAKDWSVNGGTIENCTRSAMTLRTLDHFGIRNLRVRDFHIESNWLSAPADLADRAEIEIRGQGGLQMQSAHFDNITMGGLISGHQWGGHLAAENSRVTLDYCTATSVDLIP